MSATPLVIAGAFVLDRPVWPDDRGFFREWFTNAQLADVDANFTVAQANLSMSRRDVVRGLHYSLAPEGQAKVVTCAWGQLVDVLVDIRVGSSTYARVAMIELAADETNSVYVPAGVAHGFCVTSEVAALTYLLSSPFNAPCEFEITPFDPELAIAWPVAGEPVLSAKDADAPTLRERLAAGQLPHF